MNTGAHHAGWHRAPAPWLRPPCQRGHQCVHGSDRDRYSAYLASFRKWAADADLVYAASAQETGGSRHIRYVTAADCTPTA